MNHTTFCPNCPFYYADEPNELCYCHSDLDEDFGFAPCTKAEEPAPEA